MISMKKIAEICGVSEATVSNALNNRTGVGEKKRELIKTVAKQYNYISNALVKGIQQGSTRTIGIMVSLEYEDGFAAKLMKGIDRLIYSKDFSAITVRTDGKTQTDRDIKLIRNFAERRVDGLLVIAKKIESSVVINELKNFYAPVVLVDQSAPGDEFDFVGSDDIPGSEAAAEHLISLGHSDIAFIGNLSVTTGWSRLEGFRNAMSKHGITVHQKWICNATDREAYDAVVTLLRQTPRPTAIMCFNDLYALKALAVAYDMGIKIPEYLSVTGYADLPVSSEVRPAITTVSQHAEKIGESAADLLLRRITEKQSRKTEQNINFIPEKILLPTELIVRKSTASYNSVYQGSK